MLPKIHEKKYYCVINNRQYKIQIITWCVSGLFAKSVNYVQGKWCSGCDARAQSRRIWQGRRVRHATHPRNHFHCASYQMHHRRLITRTGKQVLGGSTCLLDAI